MLDKNILLDNVRTLYNKVLLCRSQKDKPKNISLIASLYMINYNEQGFTNSNIPSIGEVSNNFCGYAYKNIFGNYSLKINKKLEDADKVVIGLYLVGVLLTKNIDDYKQLDIVTYLKDKKDVNKDSNEYGNIYGMFVRDILFDDNNLLELLNKLEDEISNEKRRS